MLTFPKCSLPTGQHPDQTGVKIYLFRFIRSVTEANSSGNKQTGETDSGSTLKIK
jgi:hypothetical protein